MTEKKDDKVNWEAYEVSTLDLLFPKAKKKKKVKARNAPIDGRLVQGECRLRMYPLRFHDSERKRWDAGAKRHEMRLADFMRWCLDCKCK